VLQKPFDVKALSYPILFYFSFNTVIPTMVMPESALKQKASVQRPGIKPGRISGLG
jgi:hypothetical protein